MNYPLFNSILSLFILILFHTDASSQGNPAFHEIFSGLTTPVAMANAGDGSHRLFICENPGRVQILTSDDSGTFSTTQFLDITDRVDSGSGEQGLLGIAFHPEFPDSNYFYLNYIVDGNGEDLDTTRVSRFSVNPLDSNMALSNSEVIIIQYEQDYSNHNGGDLKFGSDGFLYISSGDGGDRNDPNNRAQDTMSLLGKILRLNINIDQFPGNDRKYYTIPADNPFVDAPGDDEIWSYGWRNPWRFSFDPVTDIMFVGDVGQDAREEISVDSMNLAGRNFGWRCLEGTFNTGNSGCLNTPTTGPIFEMSHGGGGSICSVTGGYVYRGFDFPAFYGWYFLDDFCSGDLFMLDTENNYDSTHFDLSAFDQVSTFGVSERNELYVARLNGTIYRVVDQDQCPDDITVNIIDTSAYIVDGIITSDATLNVNDTVFYSALEAINLEGGFEIPGTSVFTADNVGCTQSIVNKDLR